MDCKIRYDVYRDARPEDLAEMVMRGVCLVHGIRSDSDKFAVRDNQGLVAQAQVVDRMANKHEEMGL